MTYHFSDHLVRGIKCRFPDRSFKPTRSLSPAQEISSAPLAPQAPQDGALTVADRLLERGAGFLLNLSAAFGPFVAAIWATQWRCTSRQRPPCSSGEPAPTPYAGESCRAHVQIIEEGSKMTDVGSSSSTELVKRLRTERSPLAHLAADTIEKLKNERVKDKVLITRLREDLHDAYEALVSDRLDLDRLAGIVEASQSGEMHDGLRKYLEEAQGDSERVTNSNAIADMFDDLQKKIDRYVSMVNDLNKHRVQSRKR
jgi:hypothetical protein